MKNNTPRGLQNRISGPQIRSRIKYEELDHALLTSILKDYEQPNKKIHDLLKQEVLLQVKRGIYVFSRAYNQQPISLEILANMIYGPSAISMEWALSHHGLIPERVTVVTSITTAKDRKYQTALGKFIYRHLPPKRYSYSIERTQLSDKRFVLLATPEKALCDYIVLSTKPKFKSSADARRFLIEEMRIDTSKLLTLKAIEVRKIAKLYKKETLFQVYEAIEELQS